MNTPDIIAIVSAGTAIVSAVIAVFALIQSGRAGRDATKASREANDLIKQQVTFQERLTQIEQSREHARLKQELQANLRAEIRKPQGKNAYELGIRNTGKGTARNIFITLDGKPLSKHEDVLDCSEQTLIIGPESQISFMVVSTFDSPTNYALEATWDDDSGQQGKYSTTLTY